MIVRSQGTQKETEIIELNVETKKASKLLHYAVDYDTTKPEDTLRKFVSDIKGMMQRFEGNKVRISEIEKQLGDIEHYIEISTNKTVPNGYKLYRKLAELRRERRACKNENDLLQPIYDGFHTNDILNRISKVQGDCAKAKEAIDERVYQIRTSILDEYLNPKKSENDENDKNLFESFLEAKIPEEISQ